MNSKPVVALPHVESDLRAAIAHYSTWRSDGADHVLEKYDETVRWIAWNPDAFPKKYGSVQRAILKQSYYLVYFIQESDRSLIIAILDGRRDPRAIRTLLVKRSRKS
jgi:plasmid stabilization system protein ParE